MGVGVEWGVGGCDGVALCGVWMRWVRCSLVVIEKREARFSGGMASFCGSLESTRGGPIFARPASNRTKRCGAEVPFGCDFWCVDVLRAGLFPLAAGVAWKHVPWDCVLWRLPAVVWWCGVLWMQLHVWGWHTVSWSSVTERWGEIFGKIT